MTPKILLITVIIGFFLIGLVLVIGGFRKWKFLQFPTGILAKGFPYFYLRGLFRGKADQALLCLYIMVGIAFILGGIWIAIYAFFL
jgi:hypothetical protein